MRFSNRFLSVFVAAALAAAPAVAGGEPVTSAPFAGVKANKGTVTLAPAGQQWTLTLSSDFVVPDTPAPHWQVVDGRGNSFLLQRLVAKDNNFHRTIVLPSYITDVAKVQIWCSFAETLLGEAGFAKVQPLHQVEMSTVATSVAFAGVKANKGTVGFGTLAGQRVLKLSADFVVPDTPAPHWQVVDSQGRTYLLGRLVAKDGKYNQTITLPAYVKDVVKVQIWCAFAEVLLGEASFLQAQQ